MKSLGVGALTGPGPLLVLSPPHCSLLSYFRAEPFLSLLPPGSLPGVEVGSLDSLALLLSFSFQDLTLS